jgi:4-amino-4-deoxy-L-arabinose transferase-like glycosyltransferase
LSALTRLAALGSLSRNAGEGEPGAQGRVGEGSGLRPHLLLCLLCLILHASGLAAIPPLDRDEARFAQATRQMLETGDFICIRFQDQARNKKPIGIYWLQAGAVSAFSSPKSAAIWPYRVPSVMAATITVLLTFGIGGRLLGSRAAGFTAAVLTASALGVVVEAHLAKTDAALLAATVAGQGALGLMYLRSRSGRRIPLALALLFWAAEGAAVLLKGPLGPVLAVLTIAALSIADREIRWTKGLRPIAGSLLLGLIVAPWLIAVESATGGRFLPDAIFSDFLPKLTGGQESHGAPPGYYVALAGLTFWPGSLFAVPAVLWGWRRRRIAAERFVLAWLVPGWVLLELVPTKLPHYVLPLYPALALLVGGALAEGGQNLVVGRARFFELAVKILWVMVTMALAAALIALPSWFGGAVSPANIAAAVALPGLGLMLLLRNWRATHATALIAALAMTFVLPAALEVVPGLNDLWLSRSAAAAVARHPPRPGEALLAVGYSEPSLVFLLGTATRLVTAAPGDDQLSGAGIAVVNSRDDLEFRQSLARHGLTAQALDRVAGLDYSAGGARLVLTLYRLKPG